MTKSICLILFSREQNCLFKYIWNGFSDSFSLLLYHSLTLFVIKSSSLFVLIIFLSIYILFIYPLACLKLTRIFSRPSLLSLAWCLMIWRKANCCANTLYGKIITKDEARRGQVCAFVMILISTQTTNKKFQVQIHCILLHTFSIYIPNLILKQKLWDLKIQKFVITRRTVTTCFF